MRPISHLIELQIRYLKAQALARTCPPIPCFALKEPLLAKESYNVNRDSPQVLRGELLGAANISS